MVVIASKTQTLSELTATTTSLVQAVVKDAEVGTIVALFLQKAAAREAVAQAAMLMAVVAVLTRAAVLQALIGAQAAVAAALGAMRTRTQVQAAMAAKRVEAQATRDLWPCEIQDNFFSLRVSKIGT